MPVLRMLILVGSLLASTPALGDSMRCGRQLVTDGDTVARLLERCGPPASKQRARATQGNHRGRSVERWVYPRGRRQTLAVTVLDGRIVAIRRL